MSYPTSDLVMVALATADTYEVLQDIADERVEQVEKWGDQSHHPDGTSTEDAWAAELVRAETDRAAREGRLTWRHILAEEVAEAFAESDPNKLYAELIQVAAVAAAWAETIRARSS